MDKEYSTFENYEKQPTSNLILITSRLFILN